MARRKRPLHPSLDMRDHVAEGIRMCEWPNCSLPGAHPAPKSRENLRDYRWFCLDHVRQYNKSWNFIEGMNDAEVEAMLRRDTVWDRPSWPLGESDERPKRGPKPGFGPFGFDPEYFSDDFGLFEDMGVGARGGATSPEPEPATRAALALFGLDLPVTPNTLKAKYKELVKKHHPDANGGDKEAEEKFKQIRAAYETLRTFLIA